MKKVLVSILAVLYLGLSIGATIDVHYCMGKLLDVDFNHKTESDNTCNKCGMKKLPDGKGCCRNAHMALSIERVQNFAPCQFQFVQTTSENVFTRNIHFPPSLITKLSFKSYMSLNKFPGKSTIPIYLINRVIRI